MNVYLPYTARLPSAYQEVEYIQSSGTQYIKLGSSWSSNYKTVIDFQMTVIGGDYVPIGIKYNTNRYGIDAYNSYFQINGGGNIWTQTILEDTNRHTITIDKGTAIVDGNNYSVSYTNYTFSQGIGVFCYNEYDRTPQYTYKSSNKLYKLDIYDENGTHIYDLVPCYRKSDNVIGLYDLVNNQFYTNSGTGTFSKGSDVTMAVLKNAYIGEVWTPGSNTLAYYPLESDGNDYSGNGHNLTWNSTPSYGVSGGTKSVVNLGGNKLGKISNLSGTYTNYTFNVWCKSVGTGTWQEIFDNFNSNGSAVLDAVYFNFNGTAKELGGYQEFAYQYRPNGGTNAYKNVYSSTNRSTNTWYNICVTSTSSGIKLYINGTQVASNSTTGAIILDSGKNCIGGRYDNGSSTNKNFFNGYLSEFIFEGVTWAAEQVAGYYNQTKSDYGL